MFFRRAEQSHRQQSTASGSGHPAGNFECEFRNERRREAFQSGWLLSSTSAAAGMDPFTSSPGFLAPGVGDSPPHTALQASSR